MLKIMYPVVTAETALIYSNLENSNLKWRMINPKGDDGHLKHNNQNG